MTFDANLAEHHTFGVSVCSRALVVVDSVDSLARCYRNEEWQSLPKLVVGGGSNLLFTEDFNGLVILNRIKERTVSESSGCFRLHLGAGEGWHEVVAWSLEQGMPGLENLALIPGTVGAAPVQNIGAYGVELADFCEYVDYWDCELGKVVRLPAAECHFGYRESIFKGALKGRAVVVAVGLALPKAWSPKLGYGPLAQLGEEAAPSAIFEAVCQIRSSKLPDPEQLGNAGSFFKNPVIDAVLFERIQRSHPEIPSYPAGPGEMKVPAGWLIDQAGLKGYQVGDAAVHTEQALVLVNRDKATAEEITTLARHVVATVEARYGIELEPEVRILDGQGGAGW
ncbi:UDP-N-acetylmuramate dehydrogenase [Ferrimonas balearica]|uniref:UDP-N-acetylmuramate dehydrogenase n=1 Tax=Ferrimonas balearica TaxID=44012 RepID=UPI001C9A06E4|nr:UDP-N-acetylmuramate dehydrogenase [Ferrimonas balearica]MBY5923567.1 UDP-N-acetylmuramate dehydrogenase [Ferrimonas balearica]MBY5997330.1 UDP-N-acetylmuramate dehydrogenase [Ferrimonas balearica]